MPLRDLINENLVSCDENALIPEVCQIMKTQDVGAVLVIKDAKPIGIITDRDIVVRGLAENLDLKKANVGQLMSTSVDVVSWDMGLEDVITLMRDKKIRRVPVVDDQGKGVGLISFGDVFGLLAKEMADLSRITPVEAA